MIRQKLGQSLFAVANKLRRVIDKEHQGMKISGVQSRALNFIYRNSFSGDVYQKDLETFFSIRSSSATELINKLDKAQLINRIVSDNDKRMKKLILTDKGVEVVKKTHNILDKIEICYVDKIGTDKHQEFIELLHQFELTLDEKEDSYV